MTQQKTLLLTIITFLCLTNLSHAQLFVEEGKLVHTVRPGTNVTGSTYVHNTSDETINISMYWEDFEYVAPFDGTKKFLPPGTGEASAANWVSFSPSTASLGPYAKQKISYVINAPAEAQGGYYGVLFFERDPIESKFQNGLSIVTRVGTLFFVETEGKNKAAAIQNLMVTHNTISGQFVNQGNVVLIPDGVYYIMDQEGLVVDRNSIEKIYLPAQSETEYAWNISEDIQPGSYTLVLTVDLQEGDVLVKEIELAKDSNSNITIVSISD